MRKRKFGRLIPASTMVCAVLALILCGAGPAQAAGNAISFFFGVYTKGFWAQSFNINEVGYEPNFVFALISEKELISTSWGLRVGDESGIAIRFGRDFSIETWHGMTVSFEAMLVGGISVTPKLVLGFSNTTNPIGMEIQRELDAVEGDVDRLIYLGSELGRSIDTIPEIEVFYRLHHRSGAAHFWGNVAAGHNANGVGLRIRY